MCTELRTTSRIEAFQLNGSRVRGTCRNAIQKVELQSAGELLAMFSTFVVRTIVITNVLR